MPYKNPEDARRAWREMYYRNPSIRADTNKRRRAARKRNLEYLQRIKEERGCLDCGGIFKYYQLDFDHLEDKDRSMAWLAHQPATLSRLDIEIAKCEVVCANCHRERTFSRGQWG